MVKVTFAYQHVCLIEWKWCFIKIKERKSTVTKLGALFLELITFFAKWFNYCFLTDLQSVVHNISIAFIISCRRSFPLGGEMLLWKGQFKFCHHGAWVGFNDFPSMFFWLPCYYLWAIGPGNTITHSWHGFDSMPIGKYKFPHTIVKNWVLWPQTKRSWLDHDGAGLL